MKANWWKILVVVALVAVVAIVVANKGPDTEGSRPIVSAEETSTPASKPRTHTPAVTTDSSDQTTEAAPRTESVEPSPNPKTGETCPTPPPEEPAPKPKADVPQKKAEPKAEPKKGGAESKPVPKHLPKLLDLGADKCIPCKMMKPILDELTKDYKGRLEVEFIDVWKKSDASKKYKIRSIPTQIFYDENGEEFLRHVGFFSKEDILKTFADHGIKL